MGRGENPRKIQHNRQTDRTRSKQPNIVIENNTGGPSETYPTPPSHTSPARGRAAAAAAASAGEAPNVATMEKVLAGPSQLLRGAPAFAPTMQLLVTSTAAPHAPHGGVSTQGEAYGHARKTLGKGYAIKKAPPLTIGQQPGLNHLPPATPSSRAARSVHSRRQRSSGRAALLPAVTPRTS